MLLDTNVVLWLAQNNPRTDRIKQMLLPSENKVFISVISWWEIAIKIRGGRLNLNLEELHAYAKKYDYTELPLTGDCLKAYMELPNLHKDPFDHILLAQAISFPMRFITGDSFLADYSSLVMVI